MEPPGISSCHDPGFWQLPGSLVLCFFLSLPLQVPSRLTGQVGGRRLQVSVLVGHWLHRSPYGAVMRRVRRSLGTAPLHRLRRVSNASLPSPSSAMAPSGPLVAYPAWAWGQPAQPCISSALHPLQAADIWPGWFSALMPSVSVTPRPLWIHLGNSCGCGQNQSVCFH